MEFTRNICAERRYGTRKYRPGTSFIPLFGGHSGSHSGLPAIGYIYGKDHFENKFSYFIGPL